MPVYINEEIKEIDDRRFALDWKSGVGFAIWVLIILGLLYLP